jgi:hypothetical protein
VTQWNWKISRLNPLAVSKVFCLHRLPSLLTRHFICWGFHNWTFTIHFTFYRSVSASSEKVQYFAWNLAWVLYTFLRFSSLRTGLISKAVGMSHLVDYHCPSAVPWLRSLVASLSPRRPRFAPGSFHVGFVVDKVALGQVFVRVLRFSPVDISFHRRSPNSYHLVKA